jgi:hypothetical protein
VSVTVVAAVIAAVSATAALLGTVANIVHQGRQFRDQRALLQRQAELFGLQAAGLRGATVERSMQQASLVRLDGWASRLVPKIGESLTPTEGFLPRIANESAWISSVRVCNESERVIRDVQVRFTSTYARWVRLNDGTTTIRAPLSGLGPSRSAWFDSDYRDARTDSVSLRFTDIDGRSWQMSMAGDLEAVEVRDW